MNERDYATSFYSLEAVKSKYNSLEVVVFFLNQQGTSELSYIWHQLVLRLPICWNTGAGRRMREPKIVLKIGDRPFGLLTEQEYRVLLVWAVLFSISLFTGIFLSQLFGGIGLIIALFYRFRGKISGPLYHRAIWPFAATVVVFLLSAVINEGVFASLRFLVKHYGMSLISFAAVLLLIRSMRLRYRLFHVAVIAGAISSLIGIFQHLTGIDPIYGQQLAKLSAYNLNTYLPVGLLDMGLTYAGVQMTFLLFLLPVVWRSRGREQKWLWVAWILIFVSIFVTYRRGPLFFAVAFTGLFLITRNRKIALWTIIAGLVTVVALWTVSPTLRTSVSQVVNVQGASVGQRVILWDAASRMGADHPLLGVGPGHWRNSVKEYVEDDTSVPGRSFAHPHSDPLNLWATTGAAGLLAMTVLVLMLFYSGFRDLRRFRVPDPDRDFYLGGLLALAGLIAASFSQCYMLDGENMLSLAWVLGVMLNAREGVMAQESA